MKKYVRITHRIFAAIAIVAFIAAFYLFFWYRSFLHTPLVPESKSYHYVIVPGRSIYTLINNFEREYAYPYAKWLRLYIHHSQEKGKIQAGEYTFNGGILPAEFLRKITRGDVVIHRFTIVEGWTFAEIKKQLCNTSNLKHTICELSDKEIAAKLNIPFKNLEGLFFPDTYQYVLGYEDTTLLYRAYVLMQKQLYQAWIERDPNLPYQNPYDALIVASMIEKETPVVGEKPRVARVILSRLQKHMRLQFDSTVIYGMKDAYKGHLSRTNLHQKTIYNTYTESGLPPTPIAMPGKDSLVAALHPSHEEVLYFVATGHGGHTFSRTIAEHSKAVIYYRHLLQLKHEEQKQTSTKTPILTSRHLPIPVPSSNAKHFRECPYYPINLLFLCNDEPTYSDKNR